LTIQTFKLYLTTNRSTERRTNSNVNEMQAPNDSLPTELLILIFNPLQLQELIRVSQVCSIWRQIAFCSQLWSKAVLELNSKSSSSLTLGNHKSLDTMNVHQLFIQKYKCSFAQIRTFKSQGELSEAHLRSVLQFTPNLTCITLSFGCLSSQILSNVIQHYSGTLKSTQSI